ncbi:MAG TPA: Na+/H+ antiporter NhaA [Acidimicrobiales bacterium]|nr:Na+/H+ antiporter NhaA [Acidimicrobiales bacterium]
MTPLADRLRSDRSSGVGLAVASLAALLWANLPGGAASYQQFWTGSPDLRTWVNQGLLTVFFTLVGFEIRREVTAGELRTVRRALIPVLAALTGMALPAGIFTLVVAGGTGAHAWGVPMATDVAFALGALALVTHAPPRARVFLMTLAVADDVFSIVVLVVFYSHGVQPAWLLGAVAALAATAGLWALRRPGWPVRLALIAFAWWALHHAGVEASVTGVALGILGPPRGAGVRRWVGRLEPWVNVVVLPLFGLANIGVALSGSVFTDGAALRVFLAVVLARVLGKPLGIASGALLTHRAVAVATEPRLPRRRLVGVGALASIGFTVPLLIIGQAFRPGPLATAAIDGLLASTLLGLGLGGLLSAGGPAPDDGALRPHFSPNPTIRGDTFER